MTSRSIQVYGRVQGVAFRYSTKNKAEELNIYGTVKNMSDGTVFIEAIGQASSMEAFIKWCYIGPRLARVDDIQIKEIRIKSFSSFDIIRT